MSWTLRISGRSPTRCCTSACDSPDDLLTLSVNPRSEGTIGYAAQVFRIRKREKLSVKSFSLDHCELGAARHPPDLVLARPGRRA